MKPAVLDWPWLEFDLGRPHQVLSWALNSPGLLSARRILWREVRDSDLKPELDAAAWLRAELSAYGASDAVGFLTSCDLRRYSEACASVENVTAKAVASVGLSNAERIGQRIPNTPRKHGTINIALCVSTGLTKAALLEVMSIVVQARTAAIMDSKLLLPTGIASGTGTDCVAVAAPIGTTNHAGLHTALGEATGRSVYTAVAQGARQWMRQHGLALEPWRS